MAHSSDSMADWTAYLTHPEIAFLKKLAQSLPASPVVVNVGVGSGTSGLAFMESRDDLRLVSVDIQLEASPLGCLYSEFIHLQQAGYLPKRSYQANHGDSREIAKYWKDGPVDMVFVDDGHEYEECLGDILGWGKWIKQDGIIAVHDYLKDIAFKDRSPQLIKPWPGVDRAVQVALEGDRGWDHIDTIDSLIAFRKNQFYDHD